MTSLGMLLALPKRLSMGFPVRAVALPLSTAADACQPSSSSRSYCSQGEQRSVGARRAFRRPMRYGSKLAIRNPELFRRMKAVLGYPDDNAVAKVDRVTISTLQTMKYLMPGGENLGMLQGMASYKVTTLNRELIPLLDRTEALLKGK
ncbi:hypothetical protein VOLCADRAFT_89160 [Volvox carteri f. nagariensis]|uniref:Uncharacterized protein n=1 Tax=Volvox carteri f. nagariensis TaxID=3068 RepID=D8TQY6_VOLCA|nr:uncharacterized protein VOLCADRAFT_89160 [Volvox carteri f. nagariensis]EFJ50241.1 hypothetical protein VOLCADRAFT_89160 [Volvox carteri f. nagariensis]|eukprot:XP_002948861.1 hypothetical protein VOLCADRAFT_89160 [Volvox carteri f. nagariensis]